MCVGEDVVSIKNEGPKQQCSSFNLIKSKYNKIKGNLNKRKQNEMKAN